MFVDTSFTNDIVTKIFADGKIHADEPIFKDFNSFLTQLGLDVAFTTFHLKPKRDDQSENRSDNGNDLGIYLKTSTNFSDNGFDENNNWNGNFTHTDLIKSKWKELAKQYNYSEKYYDFVAHVFVYDFEKIYLYQLLRETKPRLLNEFETDKWKIKPKYIFCSSFAGFNIIYDGFINYYFALSKGDFSKINRTVDTMLARNDRLNMYNSNSIKVNFYHAKMKGINLYGLSRED